MANETLINKLYEIIGQIITLGGEQEVTSIVPGILVADASPADLPTGYIKIVNPRDGTYVPCLMVSGLIVSDNDLVNVLFTKGTEPIALSQSSGSPSSSIKVSQVWESDFGAVAWSTDAGGNLTGTANLLIPSDLIHVGDADTFIRFEPDKVTFQVGGAELLALIEDAQDEIVVNDGQADIDFRIETDNEAATFFTEGSSGFIGIGLNSPTAKLHLSETYTDSTSHNAMRIIQSWQPSTTSGAQFPTSMFFQPTYDTTHSPSSGILSAFRMFGGFGNSGVMSYRGLDLRFNNSGGGTIAAASDIHIRANLNDGGGAITEYRAINIESSTAAGTNYAILQAGAGMISRFAGKITIGGATNPTAQLRVDQSSTTAAIPVITVRQADVSEQMFNFDTTIGVGNAIEAVGAKTLTTTHFVKVTIPGGLTRYFPVGTIA